MTKRLAVLAAVLVAAFVAASAGSAGTRCRVYSSPSWYGESVAATAVTSCPFAHSVAVAVWSQVSRGGDYDGPTSVVAWSPVTGRFYLMRCTVAWTYDSSLFSTCRGGTNAVVRFYIVRR